jgi:hypothetical protein
MIPGFNSDVAHEGVVYHVQTEDLGVKDPAILTLVYRGGAILLRERTAYDPALQAGPASRLKHLMEAQHRRVIGRVAQGALVAEPPTAPPVEPPAGVDPATSAVPSLPPAVEQMIADYLRRRKPRPG